jgi:hypothetical protein
VIGVLAHVGEKAVLEVNALLSRIDCGVRLGLVGRVGQKVLATRSPLDWGAVALVLGVLSCVSKLTFGLSAGSGFFGAQFLRSDSAFWVNPEWALRIMLSEDSLRVFVIRYAHVR